MATGRLLTATSMVIQPPRGALYRNGPPAWADAASPREAQAGGA